MSELRVVLPTPVNDTWSGMATARIDEDRLTAGSEASGSPGRYAKLAEAGDVPGDPPEHLPDAG